MWNSNGISYSSPLLCFYTLLSHHLNQRSIAILNSYFNDSSKLYFHNHTGNLDDFHIATLSRTVFAILTKIMYPNRLILAFFDVSSEENIFHYQITWAHDCKTFFNFSLLTYFLYICLFFLTNSCNQISCCIYLSIFCIIQNSYCIDHIY